MKSFIYSIVCVIIYTVAAVIFYQSHRWNLVFIAGFLMSIRIYLFYSEYTRHTRRMNYLLDAVENEDYTLRFPVKHKGNDFKLSHDDEEMNRMLNRLVEALSHVKTKAIQQEKYYEQILNLADTGIVVLNSRGDVYQTNRALMRLLGMEVWTHVDQLKSVSPELLAALRSARPGEQRQVTTALHLTECHLAMRVSGVNLHGEELRIVAVSDIHRELDDREIDTWIRLTRVLTHEIMNGLTPVTSLSQTLLTLPGASQPEMRQGLEAIHSTGEGLLQFVGSYRRLTHLPTPHPTLFNVKPFLERQLQLAKSTSEVQATKLEAADDLMIYADEGLMALVVTNILKNAVQAITLRESEKEDSTASETCKGEITVRAYCAEDESVHIEIANNGPKISPEVAEHIFMPFFSTKSGGSGIGLSLSKQIMRISGGELTLLPYSATGEWTVFSIHLL